MYYTEYDVKKAQEREKQKLIKYKTNSDYIEHFKMIFKKDSIKINITEKNYISNYKVQNNEYIKKKILERDNKTVSNKCWLEFDNNKKLHKLAQDTNMYPWWVKYDFFDNSLIYNREYIRRMTPLILENYNLNMRYFENLNKNEFDNSLNKILGLKKNSDLKEVYDLKQYIGTKGIYILIIDKYKQIYVGQSKRDIVERIIRHWKRKIEFENLLVGKTSETKISIDSFGILDTTRIFIEVINPDYYNNSMKIDDREEYLVKSIPDKFLINKVGGGIRLGEIGSFEKFIETYRTRKL